ncbi:hypothetical protein Ndes2526B_g04052 [Nannochloris sp. 'desiccata']|nr:hypothetical protein KSW81_005964 [Chlorella desiccata (nom. nud.)]
MNVRSKLRIAVFSPIIFSQTAKNNRAAALATRHATSRPPVKSTEEQDLEWDYEQLLQHKNPESKMEQPIKWLNPACMAVAINVCYTGFLIFQKTGLAELTAYVGFLGALFTAAKYGADCLSEQTSRLKQLPAVLAKMHSRLKTEIMEHLDQGLAQQKTEILEAMEQQKTVILAAINGGKP